jgi:hypothetical protein
MDQKQLNIDSRSSTSRDLEYNLDLMALNLQKATRQLAYIRTLCGSNHEQVYRAKEERDAAEASWLSAAHACGS